MKKEYYIKKQTWWDGIKVNHWITSFVEKMQLFYIGPPKKGLNFRYAIIHQRTPYHYFWMNGCFNTLDLIVSSQHYQEQRIPGFRLSITTKTTKRCRLQTLPLGLHCYPALALNFYTLRNKAKWIKERNGKRDTRNVNMSSLVNHLRRMIFLKRSLWRKTVRFGFLRMGMCFGENDCNL